MLRSLTVTESGYYVYYFKTTRIKLSPRFITAQEAMAEVASCVLNGLSADWAWLDINCCVEGNDLSDVRILVGGAGQPSPYSSTSPFSPLTTPPQLTFKPIDPDAKLESVTCSCGPKFNEDPHKKECGLKDQPK